MANTTAEEVINSFHSTFRDKVVIAEGLEIQWLKKAVADYSIEIDTLNFDSETMEFDSELSQYVIDTLGLFMKLYYQERQVSKVNKRASIVTSDFSFDGSNGMKTSERAHLEFVRQQLWEKLDNLKTPAYS